MNKIKDSKIFIIFSILMGFVVIISNYLVQFPFTYFGFEELLTYGAFSYPIAFLITDLTNRKFGIKKAKQVVYFGFLVGILLSIFFSLGSFNLITLRITFASATAFLIAQLIDVNIFNNLRKKEWFIPPLVSSVVGSIIDTIIFFSIAFYGTEINWISLAFGDLCVKIFVALFMLIPFRILLNYIKDANSNKKVLESY